jgi:hypothetical protein
VPMETEAWGSIRVLIIDTAIVAIQLLYLSVKLGHHQITVTKGKLVKERLSLVLHGRLQTGIHTYLVRYISKLELISSETEN